MIEILPIELHDILFAIVAWGVIKIVLRDKKEFLRLRRAQVRFKRWMKRTWASAVAKVSKKLRQE